MCYIMICIIIWIWNDLYLDMSFCSYHTVVVSAIVNVLRHPFTIKCLFGIKMPFINTLKPTISRSVVTAHPVKNISMARQRETWTRNTLGFFSPAHGSLYTPWISKNGFPSPFTPSYSVDALCIGARMVSAVSFHYWDKKNTTTLDCWTWFKAIVLKLCFCN